MPRTRFVPVPESDTEIIEEEITQHETKQGVRLKTKRTPMSLSLPTNAEMPSGSRSKAKKKAQAPRAEKASEMAEEDNITQTYEPGNNFEYEPDDIPEELQPLANVCRLCTHSLSFISLICARLLWINGSNIGVHISMCFSKWRVGALSLSAHYAQRVLHISSAPIASGEIFPASRVACNTIGGYLFTVYSNGMQGIIRLYPCTHWDLFYFLDTMENHVRKLSRYFYCRIFQFLVSHIL